MTQYFPDCLRPPQEDGTVFPRLSEEDGTVFPRLSEHPIPGSVISLCKGLLGFSQYITYRPEGTVWHIKCWGGVGGGGAGYGQLVMPYTTTKKVLGIRSQLGPDPDQTEEKLIWSTYST